MTQPTLFDDEDGPLYGYQGDVGYQETATLGTSRKAAHSISKGVQTVMWQTILTLLAAEPRTSDQISIVTGWAHQSVSARITELKKLNKVKPTGERRETRCSTPTRKRTANVWAAV